MQISQITDKLDRFSCSQNIWLKWDPPVYRKDRKCSEKRFLLWSEENTPPPEFLKKVRGLEETGQKNFLESILDQDLEPNFSPKLRCKCPKLAKLADKQTTQETNKPKAPTYEKTDYQ